jgi:hypothetical protein
MNYKICLFDKAVVWRGMPFLLWLLDLSQKRDIGLDILNVRYFTRTEAVCDLMFDMLVALSVRKKVVMVRAA